MENEGKSCMLVSSESNSVHEKIRCFRLAENEYILMYHKTKVVIRVQITNSARALLKFRLSRLSAIFVMYIITSNNMIQFGGISTCKCFKD